MSKRTQRRKRNRQAAVTEEQVAAFYSRLAVQEKALPAEMREHIKTLRRNLLKVPPAALLTEIVVKDGREKMAGRDPSDLGIEYATWLYLIEPSFPAEHDASTETLAAAEASRAQVMSDMTMQEILGGLRDEKSADPRARLQSASRIHNLWTRRPHYRSHEREELARIDKLISSSAKKSLPLSINKLLHYESVLFELVTKRLWEAVQDASLSTADLALVTSAELAAAASTSHEEAELFLTMSGFARVLGLSISRDRQ